MGNYFEIRLRLHFQLLRETIPTIVKDFQNLSKSFMVAKESYFSFEAHCKEIICGEK